MSHMQQVKLGIFLKKLSKNSWNWRKICTTYPECKQTFMNFSSFGILIDFLLNPYSKHEVWDFLKEFVYTVSQHIVETWAWLEWGGRLELCSLSYENNLLTHLKIYIYYRVLQYSQKSHKVSIYLKFKSCLSIIIS